MGEWIVVLGGALLVISTLDIIEMLPAIMDRPASNLLRWLIGKPKGKNLLLPVIRAFQLWGVFWIISGLLIRGISQSILDGPVGTIIHVFVFFLPLVVMTLVAVKSQKKQV